ncbi:MAG: site-specific integrase [Ferruginibacter sp.]
MEKTNAVYKVYPIDQNITRTWFIVYRDKGRKIKKYGKLQHCKTLDEKIKEANRIIKELQEPILSQQISRGLIQSLSDILEYRRPSIEKKTYQTYFSKLKIFAEWFRPAYKINKEISPAGFIRHLQIEKKLTNNTIRHYLIFLKDAFNELNRIGKYKGNPFDSIRIKKVRGKSLLPFHPNQITELKNIIAKEDPQLWDAILFQYYLYFRPKEIRMLKISDILFDEMKIILRDEVAKDDDNYLKTIPIPMQKMILEYKKFPFDYYIFSSNGEPGKNQLSTNALSSRHREFLRTLNYGKRFAFYSWVHTGIKMAAQARIPIKQLQLQKGHSDLKMFDEYLKDLGVDDCNDLKNNFPEI